MTAVNRETCRDALAALLEAELVTNLGIVQAVYGYKVGDPQGQSPIVAVLSVGSDRQGVSFGENSAAFFFEIQIWVLYSDPDASWTEADAEDRLDLIEKEIGEVIEDNHDTVQWTAVDYAGRSVVADVTALGGAAYILEKIPLQVEVY